MYNIIMYVIICNYTYNIHTQIVIGDQLTCKVIRGAKRGGRLT